MGCRRHRKTKQSKSMMVPQSSRIRYQANSAFLIPTPKGCLPLLSLKIIKAIQSKEYIDFNSLLPNSLYDSNTTPGQITFTLNPSGALEQNIAPPSSNLKQNITSFRHGWMHGTYLSRLWLNTTLIRLPIRYHTRNRYVAFINFTRSQRC